MLFKNKKHLIFLTTIFLLEITLIIYSITDNNNINEANTDFSQTINTKTT